MFKTFALESMGRRINLLFRLTMMYARNASKTMGVGAGDYAILFILYMEDGLSQDELSKRMRVNKSYTARAVAQLEKMGMVKRETDPHEHRIKRVFLGDNGRELQADFIGGAKNWHDILVKDIAPEDLAIIRAGLDKMLANAESALGLTDIGNDFNRKSI
ncbi:MAG: MarR family transcriptional regulator [Proteobacteria bacterium]|nr:MarR family transcriptional regulator [Pseudomonadota bacterium]